MLRASVKSCSDVLINMRVDMCRTTRGVVAGLTYCSIVLYYVSIAFAAAPDPEDLYRSQFTACSKLLCSQGGMTYDHTYDL